MPATAENARTPLKALHDLMLELFDDAEFRRWLRHGSYAAVLTDIPGESASLAEVVDRALGVLKRQGRIDVAFFDDLKRERPGKRSAIEAVETRWFGRAHASAADASDGGVVAVGGLPSDVPFYTAGTMPAPHKTYVRRACDEEFGAALDSLSFIAVEGPSGNGKSSLMRRVAFDLDASRRFCRVDVNLLRYDHPPVFMEEFFELLSGTLERPVNRWTSVVDETGLPLVIVLDEFGLLIPELVRQVVPALYSLANVHSGRVHVVACFPVGVVRSLVAFLRKSGLTTGKYCDCWRPIRVPPFGPAEIEQLVAHLPAGAAAVARAELATLARLSGGSPRAVQCVCGQLYAAARSGASDDYLRALLRKKEAYR